MLSRIYYPLLYGSIVSYRRAHRKSPLELTLTANSFNPHLYAIPISLRILSKTKCRLSKEPAFAFLRTCIRRFYVINVFNLFLLFIAFIKAGDPLGKDGKPSLILYEKLQLQETTDNSLAGRWICSRYYWRHDPALFVQLDRRKHTG